MFFKIAHTELVISPASTTPLPSPRSSTPLPSVPPSSLPSPTASTTQLTVTSSPSPASTTPLPSPRSSTALPSVPPSSLPSPTASTTLLTVTTSPSPQSPTRRPSSPPSSLPSPTLRSSTRLPSVQPSSSPSLRTSTALPPPQSSTVRPTPSTPSPSTSTTPLPLPTVTTSTSGLPAKTTTASKASDIDILGSAEASSTSEIADYKLHFIFIGLFGVLGFFLKFWDIAATFGCSKKSSLHDGTPIESSSELLEHNYVGAELQNHRSRSPSRGSTRTTFRTSTLLTVNVASRASCRSRDFEAGFGYGREEDGFRTMPSRSQASLEGEQNSYSLGRHWRAAKVFEVDERGCQRSRKSEGRETTTHPKRRRGHLHWTSSDSSSERGSSCGNPFEQQSRGQRDIFNDGRIRHRERRRHHNQEAEPEEYELPCRGRR